MEDAEPSPREPRSNAAGAPKLAPVLLLLLMGSVLLVRGHDSAWPLIGWTMYSRIGDTPDTLRTIRVDVVGSDGAIHSYFPTDPLTHVERPLVERVMWQAYSTTGSRDAARRFLVRLLERDAGNAGMTMIKGFRLEWHVPAPPEVRRIDRDRPDREIPIGAFNAEMYR